MQLINGSRIVIIGGGPAGSFTALHLLYLSAEVQLHLNVIIIEARDFNLPGTGSCNKCAGILSSKLVQNLEQLGLSIPTDVIQSEIGSYILHIGDSQLPIHALKPSRRIVSVYRGRGPRLGGLPLPKSFDGWLLDQAEARGARIVHMRVQSIRSGLRPIVATAQEEFEADLVVIATGVNSRSVLDPSWGYQPPQTEIMAQDEIPRTDGMSENSVHIYFENPPGLIFGALIPKDRYTNVSLLGHGLQPKAIKQFFLVHKLEGLNPDEITLLCGCAPRIAISTAHGFFADRLVVVGDAAVTRLYKDGIGSAFITAAAAAQTAILRGISRQDFAVGYRPVCQRLSADNSYGRLLFRLWELTLHTPILRKVWIQAVINEINQLVDNKIFSLVLWGMFTGDESYRLLFWKSLSLPVLKNFLITALKIRGNR